ncbi:ComF family protein [Mucilaginibacter auburnensis]|uniref:ComF family protein n=1 Tax=Mucilaginibacter auburnensis TaxID=1457233 RepID=A0A2H9VSS1_9SPHI|nr:phosphoribosyltransferase family protein [Mucilaginibacter auburnensis]PJJ83876.1 ComF family protein [Mucilaginibacter auburnensis]
MNLLTRYWSDFTALLFPHLCPACGEALVANEHVICTDCRYSLPFTNFHLQPENVVAQQFWGKLNIEAAYAMYYFSKGGKVQNLLHHLKYKNMPQIGNVLGVMAGDQLTKNDRFKHIDLIIPVPLHKRRMRERGYNQSAQFAQGLAERLNVSVLENNLIRTINTATQTHKSRFARFENMKEVFSVSKPGELTGKHILLVDDTVTTGSTLEACGIELLKIEGAKLSIATIAYAE